MAFFFGRRHSVAGTPSDHDGLPKNLHQRMKRRSSAPNVPTQNRERSLFQDLFRRHRESSAPGAPEKTHDAQSDAKAPEKPSAAQTTPERGLEGKVNRKKPHHAGVAPSGDHQLKKGDVEMLFSGAPYFMLEKGKQGHFYPQVIFPFDDHDPSIQSLWDRRALPHASYTLCTLHAHLPVPDRWVVSKDVPVHLDSWKKTGSPKRATFDIGIFEVPNMLAMNGRDPGAVGLRHFLELPVGDVVRYPESPRPKLDYMQLSSMPASEVYELMEHCHEAASFMCDRKQLLCDGPSAWKKLGVRDINLQALVERLQTLTEVRRELLHGNREATILDTESTRDLYSGLFTKFLYPPSRSLLAESGDSHGIKAQIRALTVTLANRGAWIDFSLPEWRLYAGQLLWQDGPHADGDRLDPSSSTKPWMRPTLERRWLLVQMLLAAELLLRLDATVRVGILDNSKEMQITAKDVAEFERLRSGKVDWDLVAVRRFMDTFDISYMSDGHNSPVGHPGVQRTRSKNEKNHDKNPRAFFGNLIHRSSSTSGLDTFESAWNCRLTPIIIDQQLQGLLVFAEEIGWPGADELKNRMRCITGGGQPGQAVVDIFKKAVRSVSPTDTSPALAKSEMYSRSPSRRRILLHSNDQTDPQVGGWITRSWLSGFVLPGESISHILMATVLENDPDALARLGPIANLYGGFAYNGETWWSKECVIGRVLASMEDTKECMGWLKSSIVPKDAWTFESLDDTWFEALVHPAPMIPGKPRIKQGHKLSLESTPLGLGDLTSGAFSMPLDSEKDTKTKVSFEALIFSRKDAQPPPGTSYWVTDRATAAFTLSSETTPPTKVTFPLKHNVRFITSHECRPPSGFASYHCTCAGSGTSTPSSSSSSLKHHRLPSHPLHSNYTYKHVALDSLRDMRAPDPVFLGGTIHSRYDVLIVDARGGPGRETFARAWCASIGYNAIIGRVGRTCLACCVREARAISVKVVLRCVSGTE
ncbi:hypothetical protein BDV25DRAFT_145760 [Aspergillus avenaceus]|uniref:Uncharacterized protein n=1 Tax=Aspergillus avenaceus TaxID=36643 RepID=A0A5N6TDG4_ASPAV|nr:hypothetical protein BDV25DRAFT_145760 [Aspergillus avenaceus]